MTYKVFGGMVNLNQSIPRPVPTYSCALGLSAGQHVVLTKGKGEVAYLCVKFGEGCS